MAKTVVIVGTLDTRGKEFAIIKDLIEKQELNTLLIDVGVLGDPAVRPDISFRPDRYRSGKIHEPPIV